MKQAGKAQAHLLGGECGQELLVHRKLLQLLVSRRQSQQGDLVAGRRRENDVPADLLQDGLPASRIFGHRGRLVDRSVAAAHLQVRVVLHMVSDEQLVVHQLQLLERRGSLSQISPLLQYLLNKKP